MKLHDWTHPSISDSSWLIVWLAYGCICELVLFAPTVSISSMKTIQGVRILAASAVNINKPFLRCSTEQETQFVLYRVTTHLTTP